MRTEVESAIRREIEHVFGRSIISSRDCIDLSQEIFKRTQQQLNPNTLRRFFGLVKADYPPSQSTLAILSKYCGFYSVEDVYRQQRPRINNNNSIDTESLLYYFDSLFRDMPAKELYDKNIFTMVKHTIGFLNNNNIVADKFQRMISKTRNGQDVYFEQFINVDKLNDYYGEGLRYYLNEKSTQDAALFAHSIMIFKYWLIDDITKVKQYGELLPVDFNNQHKYFIVARQFAATVYYHHALNSNINETLINIYRYHATLVKENPEHQRFYFEFVIAEALALTGYFPEALFYLDHAGSIPHKSFHQAFFTESNFKLLKTLCLYRLDRVAEAGSLFDAIKPSEFLFLNKKLSGILYHYLAAGLRRKNIKYRQSQASLIKETGFIMLEKLF